MINQVERWFAELAESGSVEVFGNRLRGVRNQVLVNASVPLEGIAAKA